ncbi:hypothetical protein MHW47_09710 [Streptomyces sp. OfavH-34-F]|uniref:hypothetical protein n=1 Tax=Streptomyces sp. OfavH-34-F TaxID=2917760 RepID=UPI001EF2BF8C|nr:hypothetical protein [Streptomyces sp. OfavH-34-F]MCG7524711.1 hypothetical protein [Streptomyces sp. OfavH-34-F]
MNSAQDKRQATEDHHDQEVTVVLGECPEEDARTVFDALRAAFTTDRSSADVPHEAGDGRPTVWTATVDVSEARVISGAVRLGGPVTLDVQGGYAAVDRLRAGLADAFAVRVLGTVSGDQEEEVRLRLDNR